ncbi:MAG TPA: hypothetical protein VNB49_09155, partial [Candidatus Dormibacteraeota bacterium]|nr:hypothetical protein [Candidatus Dormibacteraeota bacterium]
GFVGSLVMVADQEARLITAVIFWEGTEAHRGGAQGVRRVRALLAPYLDRCLRVQIMLAHVPVTRDLRPQASSIDTRLVADESMAQEACAASLSASY